MCDLLSLDLKTCDYKALKSLLKLYSPYRQLEKLHTGRLNYSSQHFNTLPLPQLPVDPYRVNQGNTS